VILGLIIVAALVALPYLSSDSEDDSDSDTVTLMGLKNDVYEKENYGTDFSSYEPGDTVVIKDQINYLYSDYDEYDDLVTYIWVESTHKGEDAYELDSETVDFIFNGDLTDEFSSGDTIKITLNLIYTEEQGEVFDEIWDGEDFTYFPRSCIRLVSEYIDDDDNGEAAKFPTIKVTLRHGDNDEDSLTVKHQAGDPLDWSDYKMIIINNSDESDVAILNILSGEITSGGQTTFNETSTSGFSMIDFQKTYSYCIEIYNLRENKLVWLSKTVICV
jgi:signal peptidase I